MKKITNLLLRTLTTITFMFVNISAVSADGGAYNPYKPHDPIDTGLGDIEGIAIAGAVLYTVGVGILVYSKVLKKKFIK